jgi:DNA primase
MTISHGNDDSFVTCFSCGYKKPFVNMLFELNTAVGGFAALALQAQQLEQNKTLKKIETKPGPKLYRNRIDYSQLVKQYKLTESADERIANFLSKKGIRLLTAIKFGCGFIPKGTELILPNQKDIKRVPHDVLVLPVFTKINDRYVCVGAQGRYIDPPDGFSKYYAVMPFEGSGYLFGEQMLDTRKDQTLILVEGPLDALHIAQEGFRAAALMGLFLSENKALRLLESGIQQVILMLDPDPEGQRAVSRIQTALSKYGIESKNVIPDCDPKNLTTQQLTKLTKG